ncbi:hypothetical protein P7K49_034680 [Saguinus oedipus]|uniref:Uncharacterized protein n=1 Tax=Saguinus oedipus TaxID=9490 RepID=A0ABQ9TVE6_SAGOE|nr:hypothetical protein P7K49_034680 [Saguinus oedipus]
MVEKEEVGGGISEEEAAQYDRQIRLWGLEAQKRGLEELIGDVSGRSRKWGSQDVGRSVPKDGRPLKGALGRPEGGFKLRKSEARKR